MKNYKCRIFLFLLLISFLCTTNVIAKPKGSKGSKKKVTSSYVKPNKSTSTVVETQSNSPKTSNQNDDIINNSSGSQNITEEPTKEILKILDNTDINNLSDKRKEDKPTDDISTDFSDDFNLYSQENDEKNNSISDLSQEKLNKKQVNSRKLEKNDSDKSKNKKGNKPNQIADESKSINYIEPFLLNLLNKNGVPTNNICSLQDILCALIVANLFLTFILFISIIKTRRTLSKSISEFNSKINDDNQNNELTEKLALIEENIQNNIANFDEKTVQIENNMKSDIENLANKIDEINNNIQSQLEVNKNSVNGIEHNFLDLKSELESEAEQLNDKNDIKIEEKINEEEKTIINHINDLINNNKNILEKIQNIENYQDSFNSKFESFAINEERIKKLEIIIEQILKTKKANINNNNIYGEDLAKLRGKIKSFQAIVVNHFLKDRPEYKWWVRFAEPNKLFQEELANKVICIIDDFQNKEELKNFNGFFSLFRNFCITKNKCVELINRVSKNEIVFSNSHTAEDLKKGIEQYDEELDQFITQIEILPSIELDDNGKKILSEERDKIVNLVVQESQEIDSNMANLLSIDINKLKKEKEEANQTNQNSQTISQDSSIDSLLDRSTKENPNQDINELLACESSVIVNIE